MTTEHPPTTISEREARLVESARMALTYFQRRLGGSLTNGQHDDVVIGRRLHDALEEWSDVPDRRDQADAIREQNDAIFTKHVENFIRDDPRR